MQENNQKETLPTEGLPPEPILETPVVQTEAVTTASPEVAAPVISTASANGMSPVVKKYLLAALAIVVISTGLLFVLERQGRIDTGLFSRTDSSPAAIVNGTEIKRSDYDSSVAQLVQMAATQGTDTTDPTVVAQFETQAIDTLVNGELLRQAALAAGKEAAPEAIDARFSEIEASVGGPEQLAERMGEFGISIETLRRDIENEILIQSLFDDVIGTDEEAVTEEEITAFYDSLGGTEAGLPPLAEVEAQIAEQIRLNRQQAEVGAYLETLRTDAEIEVLI